MKRMISLILALAMVFCLAACGSKPAKKMSADDAAAQVELAMKALLAEAYGDKITDSKIVEVKVYTAEEEQKDQLLKSLGLGEDEYAFTVKYELKPAEGVDANELTAATGEVDSQSGWVVEKYNVGVLRPNDGGDPAYKITNFGTGF